MTEVDHARSHDASDWPEPGPVCIEHGGRHTLAEHAFDTTLVLPLARGGVWAWLNDPATFVKGQPPPYFVEFVDTEQHQGFSAGVQNVHHGPWLNAAGEITAIIEGKAGGGRATAGYRDLQYYYGSFVGGMRMVRPRRLQFWLADGGEIPSGSSELRVRLESWCRPSLAGAYTWGQAVFWKRFFRWTAKAAVKRHSRDA